MDGTDTGATGGVTGTEGEESRDPTMVDLASILRAHMGQQEARDARLREESAQQEQRFRALQHQFQLLQLEVQARTSPIPENTSAALDSDEPGPQVQTELAPECVPSTASAGQFRLPPEPRLEKLTEHDDIEHFLITFERIAAACRWPRSDWVFRLIPLLTGKARGVLILSPMLFR